jgi:hypothetical protein
MQLLALLLVVADSVQSLPPNFILLMSDVSDRRLHLTRSGELLLLLLLLLLPPLLPPPILKASAGVQDMGWGDVSYNNVTARIHNPGAGGEQFVVNPPRTPEIDAMAASPNSLVFHRFYAGSAVCSPTRASALTGRTPDRECIDGAEGCGQMPASCPDKWPLPPTTFTIAEAAQRRGYATLHLGKVRAALHRGLCIGWNTVGDSLLQLPQVLTSRCCCCCCRRCCYPCPCCLC